MKRKIVKIDEAKCTGCGLCITGCHEGALKLVNGKAKLVSDVYCDGLGACLPACPADAIMLEEREADAFDEAAVKARMHLKASEAGCPGAHAKMLAKETAKVVDEERPSELRQWPCQIRLVPPTAPYFAGAELLIAADCTAYAYANIHQKFMRGKITLIGCPKLDDGEYIERLAAIFALNDIKSVTVLRMEVPCCGGLVAAVKQALQKTDKDISSQVVIVGTDGKIIE